MERIEKERESWGDFVRPVFEYESLSARIIGDQKLLEHGLPAPEPTLVLGHQAFLEWKENRGMTDALRAAAGEAFDQIRTANPGRGAYIGRAFYVPHVENPAGPRTADIWDKETYINEVEGFYNFVLKHGYDVPGADIALELHPFINAFAVRERYGKLPLQEGELPWSGGYVVCSPDYKGGQVVRIIANFGPDEVVKHYLGDLFEVDVATETVIRRTISYKTKTLEPLRDTSDYVPVDIPSPWRDKPALTDKELLQVAEEAMKLFRKDPYNRLEFIMQPEGPVFREIAPWQEWDKLKLLKLKPGEEAVAQVVRLETEKDLEKIESESLNIVYFPASVTQQRSTDLFTLADLRIQKLGATMIALVFGNSMVSHAAKLLFEAGHSMLPQGNRDFQDGDLVKVSCGPDGLPLVEFVDPYHRAIVGFDEIDKLLVERAAGRKIANLIKVGEVARIPRGFALTSEAVRQYLRDIGLFEEIKSLDKINLTQKERLRKTTGAIQRRIEEADLPLSLVKRIEAALEVYDCPKYIVRSSGAEDGEGRSRPGLYESSKAIEREEILKAVKATVASYFSDKSVLSIRQLSQGSVAEMDVGVWIQEYIDSYIGGVVVSSEKEMVFELKPGSVEEVVSGTHQFRATIERETGVIKRSGVDVFNLDDEFFVKFSQLVEKIEWIFNNRYQDIEFIITADNELVILQARPM
jgi:hypothetical protein